MQSKLCKYILALTFNYFFTIKVVPVPYEDLPVVLPITDEISKKGLSQLKDTDWYKTKCPKYQYFLNCILSNFNSSFLNTFKDVMEKQHVKLTH
jgi:hypothetical protein